MPQQSSPVLVPVDLFRLFFGPGRVSGPVARLTVTWFILAGGWADDGASRREQLIRVRLASWLWPPALWRAEGRVPPTVTSVLLELQSLRLVDLGPRQGGDMPVTLRRHMSLPDSLLAEIDAIVARRERGEAEGEA